MITASLITLLGTTFVGAITQIWAQKIKAQTDQAKNMMSALTMQAGHTQAARKQFHVRFEVTRQILVLTAIFAIVLLPKLVAIYMPEVSVWVSWVEVKDGFLFFTDSKDVTIWKEMKGLVITPVDNNLMTAIVGLYLGREIARA